MAFVLLPSDLPFWNRLRIHFRNISNLANNDFRLFIDEMKSIFYLCNNCNLDVDNVPEKDDEPFERFRFWLENDLSEREQNLFWSKTVPSLVRWAERLPESKPVSGFYYSLQNQTNCTILSKQFVKSLLANGFFNTFPRRSQKTHPTLTNFNFIEIFRNFNSESQKYKLKSILHFMTNDSFDTKSANLTIKRQTIDFNCPAMFFNYLSNLNSNLCPIEITLKSPQQYIYENSLSTTAATVHVSMDDEQHAINLCQPIRKHFGRHLLTSDSIDSLNCVFFTCPELLICLLFVENLNFNEILSVDNVSDSCKILGFKSQQPEIEFYEQPKTVNIRFMVANKNICDNESFLNEFHKYLYSLQMSCYSSNSFRKRVLDRFHQSSSDLDLSDFNRNSFTSDEYFTANTTLDNSDDDNDMDDDRNYFRRYSNQLSTPDRRLSFAKCIRNVLSNQSSHLTNSTDDSSYAVGIAVTGAEVYDKTIRLRRKGSTGFLLNDQSSFDSEIDDNDDDDDDDNDNEIPINELEFDQNYFYNDHLLRRTLSESCNDQKLVANQNHKNLPLFVKSLSLEIEKRRMSQPWPTQMHLSNRNPKFKQKVLIGCSNEESNIDFQLKLIIEWLAASTIGIPQLVYSTHGTNKLTMANIVTCSLFDKNCTISELFALTLDYLEAKLLNQNYKLTLFESLIKYSNKN